MAVRDLEGNHEFRGEFVGIALKLGIFNFLPVGKLSVALEMVPIVMLVFSHHGLKKLSNRWEYLLIDDQGLRSL